MTVRMTTALLCVLVGLAAFFAAADVDVDVDVETKVVELREVLTKTEGTISPEVESVIQKWQASFDSTKKLAQENVDLKAQIVMLEDSVQSHKDHEESVERTLEALRNQISGLETRMEEYKTELKAAEASATKSELLTVSLKENNDELSKDLSETQNRLEILKDHDEMLEQENKEDEENLEKAVAAKNKLQEQLILLNAQISQLQKDKKDADLEISSLKAKNANLEMDVKKKEKDHLVEVNTTVTIQGKLDEKIREVKAAGEKNDNLEKENKKLKEEIAQLKKDLEASKKQALTLENDNKTLKDEKTKITVELDSAKKDNKNLKNKVTELEKEIAEIKDAAQKEKEREEKMQEELKKLKTDKAELTKELDENEAEEDTYLTKIANLTVLINEKIESLNKQTDYTKELEEKMKEIEEEKEKLENQLSDEDKENDDLKIKVSGLESKLENAEKTTDELQSTIDSLQKDNEKTKIDAQTTENTLKEQILTLEQEKQQTTDELQEEKDRVSDLKKQLAELNVKDKTLTDKLNEAENEEDNLEAQIEALKKTIEEVKEEAAKTAEELKKKITDLETENKELKGDLEEETDDVEELTVNVQAANEQLANEKEHSTDLEKEVENLRAADTKLTIELETATKKEEELKNNIDKLEIEVKQTNEDAKTKESQLLKKISDLENDKEEKAKTIKDLKTELAELKKEEEEAEEESKTLESELNREKAKEDSCKAENNSLKKKIQDLTKEKDEKVHSLEVEITTIQTDDADDINKLKNEKKEIEDELTKLKNDYEISERKATDLSNILTEVTELTVTKEIEIFEKPNSPVKSEKTNIEIIRKEIDEIDAKLTKKEAKPEDLKVLIEKLTTIKTTIIEKVGDVTKIDLEKEREHIKALVEKEEKYLKSEQTRIIVEVKDMNSLQSQLKELHKNSREKITNLWISFAEKEEAVRTVILIETLIKQCTTIEAKETSLALKEEPVFDTEEMVEVLKYKIEEYLLRYNRKLAHLADKIDHAQLDKPYLIGLFDHTRHDKYEQLNRKWEDYQRRVKKAFEPLKRLTPADGAAFREWARRIAHEESTKTVYYIITTTTEWIDDDTGVQTKTVTTKNVKADDKPYDFRKEIQGILDINNPLSNPAEFADKLVHASNGLLAKFWMEADALAGKSEDDISKEDRGDLFVRLGKIDVMNKYMDPFFEGVEAKFEKVFTQVKEEGERTYGQAGHPAHPGRPGLGLLGQHHQPPLIAVGFGRH